VRQRMVQGDRANPVHCHVCVHHGRKEPATWLVTPHVGKQTTLLACDEHVDRVERHGIYTMKPPTDRGRRQPL
jgi:hypothetical protein